MRNRLTGLTSTGFSASFAYDPLGRRTGKTVQGVTTNFVYDGLNPVQEKNGSIVTADLLTGLGIDQVFTRTDGAGTREFFTDALGSTVAQADTAGAVQTSYTYEPFGGTSQSGAASTNSYKYTGREDDGTGLYYYRARYYSPRLQRFISEDPIGFSGRQVNLYAYVQNAPIYRIDPYGLIDWFGSVPFYYPYSTGINNALALVSPNGPGAMVGAIVFGTIGYGYGMAFPLPGSSFAFALAFGTLGSMIGGSVDQPSDGFLNYQEVVPIGSNLSNWTYCKAETDDSFPFEPFLHPLQYPEVTVPSQSP